MQTRGEPDDPGRPSPDAQTRPGPGPNAVHRARAWLFAQRPEPEPVAIARRARSDAPMSAADLIARYEQPTPPDPPAQRSHWLHTARSLVIVVVLVAAAAFVLRQYVVQTYYIPSESMEPTLHGCATCHDDRVLVEKLTYHFHGPRPGDIVVFHNPGSGGWATVPDGVLIKRVIGVAGDTIAIRGGHVYRDGHRLDEPYVNPHCNGTQNGPSERNGGYHVGPGQLFVMGDNRCDSDDSRFNGPIPASSVIGRAVMIIWPLGRVRSL